MHDGAIGSPQEIGGIRASCIAVLATRDQRVEPAIAEHHIVLDEGNPRGPCTLGAKIPRLVAGEEPGARHDACPSGRRRAIERRGEEGAIAFQAMQTGHSCMATFHAASVEKLIQRLTGNPINIPKTYVDNLNLVVIQSMVRLPNGKEGRRIISINEIVGYDSATDSFSSVNSLIGLSRLKNPRSKALANDRILLTSALFSLSSNA